MSAYTVATGDFDNSSARKLARTSDGALHCVYINSDGSYNQIYYSKSTDGGQNWTETKLTDESYSQRHPTIASDSNNYLHVAWVGEFAEAGGDRQLRYRKFTTSWQTIENLTSADYDQYYPAIAIDSNDYIHIVWCGKDQTVHAMRYIKNDGSWSIITALSTETTEVDRQSAIAIDSNDYIHVVWCAQNNDESEANIHYKKYTDSWQAEVDLTTDTFGNEPSIAIDSNDYIHVVWRTYDDPNYIIKYREYTDSWQSTESVSNVNTTSKSEASIAVDSNDYLYVLWELNTVTNLRKYTDSWQDIETVITGAYPNLIWANYPEIAGEKINRTSAGYAFLFEGSVKYFESNDLAWDYFSSSSSSSSSLSSSSSSYSLSSSSSSSSFSSSSFSSSSFSSSSSSFSSSSSSSSAYPVAWGIAWGEKDCDPDETATSWATWSNGAGGAATVLGDVDWGRLLLGKDVVAHSPVNHFNALDSHTTLTKNKYGPGGVGSFKVYYRESDTPFLQDDGAPAWSLYTNPIRLTKAYRQVKLVGE